MFDSIKNIFRAKPRKFLGIDIGTFFIRIVEIENRGGKYYLSNYGELGKSALNDKLFRTSGKNTLSLSNDNIAKAIKSILEEANIKTKAVNFSIPDFVSFFTSFELPKMSEKEISEAVHYQVRPFIPLPLDEIDLDWSIIDGKLSKTPVKVLVAAVPKDVISQYRELADIAGLKLRFLESEVFSLTRSLVGNKNKIGVIGIVDIGAWSTTCSIVENGILKNSYSFNTAGDELTKVIDRSLNVDYNEGEKLKKKYGLLSLNAKGNRFNGDTEFTGFNNLHKDIFPIIPSIDSILEEIKKVFRNFYRDEGKEVNRVVLAGGTALMPGLQEYFKSKLKREIVLANSFSKVIYPSILEGTIKKMKPTYGIATGLALKGFE